MTRCPTLRASTLPRGHLRPAGISDLSIFAVSSGSMTMAKIFISAPQRGHSSGSVPYTFLRSLAQVDFCTFARHDIQVLKRACDSISSNKPQLNAAWFSNPNPTWQGSLASVHKTECCSSSRRSRRSITKCYSASISSIGLLTPSLFLLAT